MALTKIDDRGLKTPIDLLDNEKIRFGTGNDLELFHDGSNSYIKDTGTGALVNAASAFWVNNAASNEVMIVAYQNGAVELNYDNSKKFETTSYGSAHTGVMRFENSGDGISLYDSRELKFGNGDDLKIYHSGSDNFITASTQNLILKTTAANKATYLQSDAFVEITTPAAGETMAKFIKDGAVELYHNNVKKFETVSYGVVSKGSVEIQSGSMTTADSSDSGTSNSALFGTGNDLKIFHDGTNSHLHNATGTLRLRGDTIKLNNAGASENYLVATNGGAVELYYDNVKKIETTTQAVKITGGIAQVATAAAALELDLNTSNYFTKTISGNSTFTFANPAASGQVTAFTLELTHSSGTVTWPSEVKWNADTAPTLTTGKTHLFMFVTDDGGSRYRGSALVDYVN